MAIPRRSEPSVGARGQASRRRPLGLPSWRLGLAAVSVLCLLSGGEALGATRWVPIGPPAATVFSLVHDPFNPAHLFAGTYAGGLYASADGGLTWTPRPAAFSADSVSAIAMDPGVRKLMYVGTYNHGVFKSRNGGRDVDGLPQGTHHPGYRGPGLDPSAGRVVLAATFAGVFRSVDGGNTWALSNGGQPSLPGRNLLFSPAEAGRVYLGTSGLGVFSSGDAGVTWQPFQQGMGAKVVTALRADPEIEGGLYAAVGDGVFRARSAAGPWEDLTYDLGGAFVNDVLPGPQPLAATNSGIFRLDGTHWRLWAPTGARLLLPSPDGSIHVASTFGTLDVTRDGGATFAPAEAGMQNRFVGTITTAIESGLPTVYAGTDRGLEIGRSAGAKGALTWTDRLTFPGAVFDTSWGPGPRLYAGSETRGAWKSDDLGDTWSQISTGLAPHQMSLLSTRRPRAG